MRRRELRPLTVVNVGLVAASLGCLCWPGEDPVEAGKKRDALRRDQLARTYRMYGEATARLGRPPESAKELEPDAKSQEDIDTVRILGSNIFVEWGTDPARHCPQGADRTLLIHDIWYRKRDDNIYMRDVILADGTFKTITNEELAALPRPKK